MARSLIGLIDRLPWPVALESEDDRWQWERVELNDGTIHVHPLGLGHDPERDCWCGPEVDEEGPTVVVVHRNVSVAILN